MSGLPLFFHRIHDHRRQDSLKYGPKVGSHQIGSELTTAPPQDDQHRHPIISVMITGREYQYQRRKIHIATAPARREPVRPDPSPVLPQHRVHTGGFIAGRRNALERLPAAASSMKNSELPEPATNKVAAASSPRECVQVFRQHGKTIPVRHQTTPRRGPLNPRRCRAHLNVRTGRSCGTPASAANSSIIEGATRLAPQQAAVVDANLNVAPYDGEIGDSMASPMVLFNAGGCVTL